MKIRRHVIGISGALAVIAAAAWQAPAVGGSPTPPPFERSGLASLDRGLTARPAIDAATYAAAPAGKRRVAVGPNVNVIVGNDVVQQGTINGVAVKTCNPGMETAQNETTIAINPGDMKNVVGGANDYRLYEPSEDRYDSSGGFYTSTNGGSTWSAGILPGLVRGDTAAPGPYESAGDPAVAAGPPGTFWYSTIAFDRTDNANSVAASRSTDGGKTWTSSFVFQTSAAAGATLFNDKEWIAADPINSNVAYVTWSEVFSNAHGVTTSSVIVISKTVDGGATWSPPLQVSRFEKNSSGSVVFVDASGTIRVTFETTASGHNWVAYATSTDGGATFNTRLLSMIADIPSPLPGATYRTDSFPGFAIDGSSLHIVWSNWTGTNAVVLYIRSTDGGATWSAPVTISGTSGNQFFPWVGSGGGKVYATWFNQPPGGADTYSISGAASTDGGASWSAPVAVSNAVSDASQGNRFGYPTCSASFIGDYSGIAVDTAGTAHSLWTDIRPEASTSSDPGGTSQDPFTATISS